VTAPTMQKRVLPGKQERIARSFLAMLFLMHAGQAQADESRSITQIAALPDSVASLDQQYSQSDIARLRAMASGQGNAAYIAYPQLILNGVPSHQTLPVQVYGNELAVDTQALQNSD